MKKYFLYELKKSAFAIACLSLIATVIYLSPLVMSDRTMLYRGASETFVWVISTVGGFLAAGVPFWVFDYKMKRRSVDLYFSLPLSHTKILTVKYLIGLIAVFAPYTVAYWLGASVAMARAWEEMYAVYYIPQYFASLLPLYFIFAVSSFIFTRANQRRDGVIFVLFWIFALLLVCEVLAKLTNRSELTGYDEGGYAIYIVHRVIYAKYFAPFAPLDFITSHFQMHLAQYMNIHNNYVYDVAERVNIIVGFTLTTLLAAGATAGLFLAERKVKAENAGQISDSWFGYRVMIPLYTVCLFGLWANIFALFYFLIVIAAYLLTALYQRTLKIGIKPTVVLVLSTVAGIILVFII